MLILLVGSLIVLYIGVGLLRAAPADISVDEKKKSLAATISSACVVTWFNPQALIDGSMMLGAFHVTLPEVAAVPFIGGVCSASCLWFLLLTLAVFIGRSRLNNRVLRGMNIICGVIIVFYGCKLLYNFAAML